jgi:hypothetical protein
MMLLMSIANHQYAYRLVAAGTSSLNGRVWLSVVERRWELSTARVCRRMRVVEWAETGRGGWFIVDDGAH